MTVAAAVIRDALVVAVIALLYVTTKRCSAAKLDRAHDATLRVRQRGGMTLTKSFTVAAENIRHFEPEAAHSVSSERLRWRRLGFGGDRPRQKIERTGGGTDLARSDPKISGGGAETPMTKQQLNGPEIGARFE